MRTVILVVSISGRRFMTVMEEDGNQQNVEGVGAESTRTDDLEAIPSGAQPVLTQESLMKGLWTPLPNAVHHELA